MGVSPDNKESSFVSDKSLKEANRLAIKHYKSKMQMYIPRFFCIILGFFLMISNPLIGLVIILVSLAIVEIFIRKLYRREIYIINAIRTGNYLFKEDTVTRYYQRRTDYEDERIRINHCVEFADTDYVYEVRTYERHRYENMQKDALDIKALLQIVKYFNEDLVVNVFIPERAQINNTTVF